MTRLREWLRPDALKVLRLQSGHKYCLLGRLSSGVGWNHYDTIKELETKRMERSQVMYVRSNSTSSGPRQRRSQKRSSDHSSMFLPRLSIEESRHLSPQSKSAIYNLLYVGSYFNQNKFISSDL